MFFLPTNKPQVFSSNHLLVMCFFVFVVPLVNKPGEELPWEEEISLEESTNHICGLDFSQVKVSTLLIPEVGGMYGNLLYTYGRTGNGRGVCISERNQRIWLKGHERTVISEIGFVCLADTNSLSEICDPWMNSIEESRRGRLWCALGRCLRHFLLTARVILRTVVNRTIFIGAVTGAAHISGT